MIHLLAEIQIKLPRKFFVLDFLLLRLLNDVLFDFRNNETLTHLLKASLGTGILSMPIAFKYSGLINGIIMTIFTAFICTHCSYVLVSSFFVFFSFVY